MSPKWRMLWMSFLPVHIFHLQVMWRVLAAASGLERVALRSRWQIDVIGTDAEAEQQQQQRQHHLCFHHTDPQPPTNSEVFLLWASSKITVGTPARVLGCRAISQTHTDSLDQPLDIVYVAVFPLRCSLVIPVRLAQLAWLAVYCMHLDRYWAASPAECSSVVMSAHCFDVCC